MRDRTRDWSERGSARLRLSLAPVSQLLWTRNERNCVQSICSPTSRTGQARSKGRALTFRITKNVLMTGVLSDRAVVLPCEVAKARPYMYVTVYNSRFSVSDCKPRTFVQTENSAMREFW